MLAYTFKKFSASTTVLFIGLWLCCVATPDLHAQSNTGVQALDTTKLLTQFIVDSWSTDQGLPNNAVLAHIKASDGYFWLATYDGLVRFDGLRSKVFKQLNTPKLTTNSLFSIYEDIATTIWIGTNGRGVVCYSQDTFSIPSFNDQLPNGTVTAFAEDEHKNLWIGTRKGLVSVKGSQLREIPDALKHLNVYCLYTDTDGVLWIGTLGEGLWRYDGTNLKQYTTKDGLSSNSVRSVKMARDGKLWIGTEEGICMMMEDIIMLMTPDLSTFVNGIDIDAYGTVWFGTDGGLVRYSQKQFELLKIGDGTSTDAIQSVFSDKEGSLWLGTYHHGLMRLRDGKFRNYTAKEGLPNELVHTVFAEKEKIWFGTDGGLSLLQNDHIQNFTLGKRSHENRIRTILRNQEGKLYIGTYSGLFVKQNNSFLKIAMKGGGGTDSRIRRLLEDKEGTIWIGTNSGLFSLKKGAKVALAALPELENSYVMALSLENNGRLWVGTNGNGVYSLWKDTLNRYNLEDGLASEVVFDIFEDRKGSLWFMTNNGLSRYKDDKFASADEQSGLFANTLFQLMQDRAGNFWFTSNRGIFQVSTNAMQRLMDEKMPLAISDFRHFSKADGLRRTEVTPSSRGTLAPDGILWFGTLQGVSAIDPIHLPLNLNAPLNKIEKVIADKKEYLLRDEVILPAGSRYFEFHYTGINYKAPAAIRFRYQLENFEEVWHDAETRRVAYYTNVPPGKYTFKVRAANEDGLWSEEVAVIPFVKEAFFYENSWFKVFALLLFLSAGILVYVMRIRKLKYQNAHLNLQVEKRTQHIRNQRDAIENQKEGLKRLNELKDRLLSIISHDLRGPLTSTMGILSLFHQRQISEKELRQFSGELSQYVGQQVNMLDNLLSWARSQMEGFHVKPASVNLYQIVEEIFMLYKQDAESKRIKLVNELEQDRYVYADKNLLQLVLRNLLFNALKFTYEQGTVSVSASFHEGLCQVEIVDNGMGMNREQLAEVFRGGKLNSRQGTGNEKGNGLGLAICKEFVEKWGGKIWAESYEGKGSRFKFTLKEYQPQAIEE